MSEVLATSWSMEQNALPVENGRIALGRVCAAPTYSRLRARRNRVAYALKLLPIYIESATVVNRVAAENLTRSTGGRSLQCVSKTVRFSLLVSFSVRRVEAPRGQIDKRTHARETCRRELREHKTLFRCSDDFNRMYYRPIVRTVD